MATNPDYPGVALTRPELAWLVSKVDFPPEQRWVAVAVMWKESRGVTNAFRPASQNPGGGNDHGLAQFNDKANPGLDLKTAYSPLGAVALMRTKTGDAVDIDGFGEWNVGRKAYSDSPYVFSSAEISAAKSAVANPQDPSKKLEAIGASTGSTSLSDVVTAPIGAVGDLASDVAGAALGPVDDIAGAVTGVLRTLSDPVWWRRIGLGVLGVGLLAAAIAIVARQQIANTAATAITGGIKP